MKKKTDDATVSDENSEKYWKEVIEVQKFNINGEETRIKQYEQSLEILAKQIDDTEKGLALDKEETELIRKLYPKHGKAYEETEEFKAFFDKKLKFILKSIDNKAKLAREQYSFQVKSGQSGIDGCKNSIKSAQEKIAEAKEKIKKLGEKQTPPSYVG